MSQWSSFVVIFSVSLLPFFKGVTLKCPLVTHFKSISICIVHIYQEIGRFSQRPPWHIFAAADRGGSEVRKSSETSLGFSTL
jgi:hypothetical protein